MLKVPVICDTGTGVIKAGFASEKVPSVEFPNLVGRQLKRYDAVTDTDTTTSKLLVGDDANKSRASLQLTRPIADGKVADWNDMEAVWDYTWDKLGITCSEHQVVQTEAALNPRANREKMAEVMFEKYGFAGLNVATQAVLALNSQGMETGFAVDSGDGVTHLVPVAFNMVEPNLVQRVNLAGRHVTEHFMKLLRVAGHALNPETDFETVREMKQKLCYVAHDVEAEKKLARETTVVGKQYTLPDGSIIRVGSERFMAPELLFTPADMGNDIGLPQMIFNTIRKTDMDLQKGYFKSIVLSGGTTMFPGFSSRLEEDIKKIYVANVFKGDTSRKFNCLVEDPPNRKHMVFLGASIQAYAQASDPSSRWFVSRQEYAERGMEAIHERVSIKLR
mmetsp:Transcript_18300/g.39434  ORF Transcript_18300/g.39434 Transcript_18300/m.39434 type:complete len:391 (-) Transcript_18300:149-1321(-)